MRLLNRFPSPPPRTPVVGLFFRGRPSTVFGAIRPVCVDAIDAVLWCGSRSHVSEKRQEIGSPFLTHDNSAAAVVRVVERVGVIAAPLDDSPNNVFWSLCHAVGSMPSSGDLHAQTSTAIRQTASKMVAGHSYLSATVATACPAYRARKPRFIRRSFGNGETAKPLSGKIMHMSIIPKEVPNHSAELGAPPE